MPRVTPPPPPKRVLVCIKMLLTVVLELDPFIRMALIEGMMEDFFNHQSFPRLPWFLCLPRLN